MANSVAASNCCGGYHAVTVSWPVAALSCSRPFSTRPCMPRPGVTESQNIAQKWHIDFGYAFRQHSADFTDGNSHKSGIGAGPRPRQEVPPKPYDFGDTLSESQGLPLAHFRAAQRLFWPFPLHTHAASRAAGSAHRHPAQRVTEQEGDRLAIPAPLTPPYRRPVDDQMVIGDLAHPVPVQVAHPNLFARAAPVLG